MADIENMEEVEGVVAEAPTHQTYWLLVYQYASGGAWYSGQLRCTQREAIEYVTNGHLSRADYGAMKLVSVRLPIFPGQEPEAVGAGRPHPVQTT